MSLPDTYVVVQTMLSATSIMERRRQVLLQAVQLPEQEETELENETGYESYEQIRRRSRSIKDVVQYYVEGRPRDPDLIEGSETEPPHTDFKPDSTANLTLISSDGKRFRVNEDKLRAAAPPMPWHRVFTSAHGLRHMHLTNPQLEHSRSIRVILKLFPLSIPPKEDFTPQYILQLYDVLPLAIQYGCTELVKRLRHRIRQRLRSKLSCIAPQVLLLAAMIDDKTLAMVSIMHADRWLYTIHLFRDDEGRIRRVRSQFDAPRWSRTIEGLDSMDPTLFERGRYEDVPLEYLWAWAKATRATPKSKRGKTDWVMVSGDFMGYLRYAKGK